MKFSIVCTLAAAMISGTICYHMQQKVNKSQPTKITCQEDMPCWDCETMGNRICGVIW